MWQQCDKHRKAQSRASYPIASLLSKYFTVPQKGSGQPHNHKIKSSTDPEFPRTGGCHPSPRFYNSHRFLDFPKPHRWVPSTQSPPPPEPSPPFPQKATDSWPQRASGGGSTRRPSSSSGSSPSSGRRRRPAASWPCRRRPPHYHVLILIIIIMLIILSMIILIS